MIDAIMKTLVLALVSAFHFGTFLLVYGYLHTEPTATMLCTTWIFLALTASIYGRVENLKLQVQFEKVKVKLLKLEREKTIRDFISRITKSLAKDLIGDIKGFAMDDLSEMDKVVAVDDSSGEDDTVAVHAHRVEDGKIVVDKVEKWGHCFEESGVKEEDIPMPPVGPKTMRTSHRVTNVERVKGGVEVTIERVQDPRYGEPTPTVMKNPSQKKAPAKRTNAVSKRISDAMKPSKDARSETAKKQYRAGGKFAKKPTTATKKIAKKPKKV